MSSILVTISLAFFMIIVCVGLMGLGWLIKGKSILKPGACGRDPTKKRDDETCGTQSSCSLCDKDQEKK